VWGVEAAEKRGKRRRKGAERKDEAVEQPQRTPAAVPPVHAVEASFVTILVRRFAGAEGARGVVAQVITSKHLVVLCTSLPVTSLPI
jgi:hypothetical protein